MSSAPMALGRRARVMCKARTDRSKCLDEHRANGFGAATVAEEWVEK